jgi:NADPH-dependent 7-cyano-7-deazaguanine reductase QueF-like protein
MLDEWMNMMYDYALILSDGLHVVGAMHLGLTSASPHLINSKHVMLGLNVEDVMSYIMSVA